MIKKTDIYTVTTKKNIFNSNPMTFDKSKLFLKNYYIVKILGEGTYGKVKLAFDIANNRMVALKFVNKSNLRKQGQLERVRYEAKLMSIIEHRTICKLFKAFETDEHVILDMEYVKGEELYDYISNNKIMTETKAKNIFLQLIDGITYLHQNRIIHRDLKPENIIIDNEGMIKIIDFGFATIYRYGSFITTHCGSPYYAAPEMITAKKYIGPEVDIWSSGIILYAMLHGKLPFEGNDISNLYISVIRGKFTMNKLLSVEVKDLLNRMICLDSRYRATMQEIYLHPWINEEMSYRRPLPLVPYNNNIIFKLIDFNFNIKDIKKNLPNLYSPEACFYKMINEKLLKGVDILLIGTVLKNPEYIYKFEQNRVDSIDFYRKINDINFEEIHISNKDKPNKVPSRNNIQTKVINKKIEDVVTLSSRFLRINGYKFFKTNDHFQVLINDGISVLFDIRIEKKSFEESYIRFIYVSGIYTKFDEFIGSLLGYLDHF
ncbi:hypothetical protein COBT_000101 [Conglomerata obtusa]